MEADRTHSCVARAKAATTQSTTVPATGSRSRPGAADAGPTAAVGDSILAGPQGQEGRAHQDGSKKFFRVHVVKWFAFAHLLRCLRQAVAAPLPRFTENESSLDSAANIPVG